MSRWRELNPRPLPYQGSALPLSHNGKKKPDILLYQECFQVSGRPGSNWPPIAWKAIALPNELLPQKMWAE